VDPTKWAGVLPLEVRALAPLSADDLAPGTAVPAHLATWRRGE
jgi:hypothetical protein